MTDRAQGLERTRIAKAAADAGFDLTPEEEGGWSAFRSTAFSGVLAVSLQDALPWRYCVRLSEISIAQRLADEFGFEPSVETGAWAVRFENITGYECLHRLLQRTAAIARVLGQQGLCEFEAATRNPPSATEAVREVVQRVGQDIFRQSLIAYWGGCCAVTGLDVAEVLRASHIKPWAACESDGERLDVFNGLLLAPHLDAVFDKGLLSFSDDGSMLRSAALSEQQWERLGIQGGGLGVALAEPHRTYLRWHRAHVFRGGAGIVAEVA